jgi:hypothetical protein
MMRYIGGAVFLLTLLVLVGCFFMSQSGSGDGAEPERKEREREGFAADRAPAGSSIDADRVMRYLRDICKIGTRISGSEGMTKQQELLKKHFEGLGATVTFQRFTARQLSRKEPVEMANMIVSWFPEREQRVILCSHYDTRPIADQEPERKNWTKPFISANDGGSGVALLMELGHHMKDLKTPVGVDFVFFDGEEYIFDPGTEFQEGDKYFFGSEHFAQQYVKSRPKYRYVAAVLFDMIGGKNPAFPIEQNSWFHAAALTQTLWKIAKEQNCTAFQNRPGQNVRDDHIALNRARIPAVDIIDFEYRHWHRLSDTPENCDATGMVQVGQVMLVWLRGMK